VNQAVGEFMMTADMIGVGVGRDGRDGLVDQVGDRRAEVDNAHARVDHQIAIPPAHMPDIAPHEGDDMGFPQQRDVVADAADFEPALGDLQCHVFEPASLQGDDTRSAAQRKARRAVPRRGL
jgi:hypothetical protein